MNQTSAAIGPAADVIAADIGMIFQPDNVLGILSKLKTQTRRLLRIPPEVMPDRELLQPGESIWRHVGVGESCHTFCAWRQTPGVDRSLETVLQAIPSPYGRPGSLIWVRERWRVGRQFDRLEPNEMPPGTWVYYEAGLNQVDARAQPLGKPRNPLFMPRWASRLSARLVEVRLQRLHDLTERDAIAEGIRRTGFGFIGGKDRDGNATFHPTARDAYFSLWDSINGRKGKRHGPTFARENPGVWALTFEAIF